MATTPKPSEPTKSPSPVDAPPEPERIVTVQEEQLARSAEMQKVGVDAWMKEHSPPPAALEGQQHQVTGISPLVHDEDEHRGRR
jgi:hypothetical protein